MVRILAPQCLFLAMGPGLLLSQAGLVNQWTPRLFLQYASMDTTSQRTSGLITLSERKRIQYNVSSDNVCHFSRAKTNTTSTQNKNKAPLSPQQQQSLVVPTDDETLPASGALASNNKDPRGNDPTQRIARNIKKKKGGRNTESFHPESTRVRPAMRVQIGSPNQYAKPIKNDDVIIVPELFGPENDGWKLYHQLVQEISDQQNEQERAASGSRGTKVRTSLSRTPAPPRTSTR